MLALELLQACATLLDNLECTHGRRVAASTNALFREAFGELLDVELQLVRARGLAMHAITQHKLRGHACSMQRLALIWFAMRDQVFSRP